MHFRMTGPEITREFPELDVLFVGAGTTGTLMGCARYMRQWHRPVRVVAVDVVGSVTFGREARRRYIPGLGTAVRPPQLDESFIDDVLFVEEADTIRTCYQLAEHGYLFGGSTGTVVFAAINWLKEHNASGLTAVAIAPDLGERYVDTIYHGEWVREHFGENVIKRQAD
jgi:cysteine synthase A